MTLEDHFDVKRMVGRPRVQWNEMVNGDARNLLDVRNAMRRLRDE